jgi:hypothetical protein
MSASQLHRFRASGHAFENIVHGQLMDMAEDFGARLLTSRRSRFVAISPCFGAMTSLAQLFRRSSPEMSEIMLLARSDTALLSIIDPHQSPKMYLLLLAPADIVKICQRRDMT